MDILKKIKQKPLAEALLISTENNTSRNIRTGFRTKFKSNPFERNAAIEYLRSLAADLEKQAADLEKPD